MLPVVTTALWFLSFMKPHANKKRGAFLEACSTFLIRVLPQVAVDCAGAVEGVKRVDILRANALVLVFVLVTTLSRSDDLILLIELCVICELG